MTRITFSDKGGRYRIKAEGHATGSPTVCAAISGIMYALAGYMQNMENTDTSSVTCGDSFPSRGRLELRDGFSEIEFSGGDVAKAVYHMTVIGLLQIAEAEPEYAEIKEDSSM